MKSCYEKPDWYSKKAFSEGYPARSVYKLQEIDEKFGILKKNCTVLDLGAAPGSWTTYLLKKGCKVVSCDLQELSQSVFDFASEDFVFFQGDFNSSEIQEKIFLKSPFFAVLCDAAPKTSGNKISDTLKSRALFETAFFYAQKTLCQGGNFAAKLFQNGAQAELLQEMRKIFESAKAFKPKACRKNSIETYLIGICKK